MPRANSRACISNFRDETWPCTRPRKGWRPRPSSTLADIQPDTLERCMTGLLSKQEYLQIAERLAFPSKCLVDGERVPAASGKTFSTHNPATGDHLADLPACAAGDVDRAVRSARAAFDDG